MGVISLKFIDTTEYMYELYVFSHDFWERNLFGFPLFPALYF